MKIHDYIPFMDEAEELQKEFHMFLSQAIEIQPTLKSMSYDDLRSVFFMLKIIELKKQIEKLEENENKNSKTS